MRPLIFTPYIYIFFVVIFRACGAHSLCDTVLATLLLHPVFDRVVHILSDTASATLPPHPVLERVAHVLSVTQPVEQVDQVQVRQLAVEALITHVHVAHKAPADLQINGGLQVRQVVLRLVV